MSYGTVMSGEVSDVSSLAKLRLLKSVGINSRLFNRNTNVAGYENQKGGTCYAHAASSAYLNSCAAIHPQEEWPSWEECLKVAVKGTEGGSAKEALERLEEKFNLGIESKILNKDELKNRKVDIRDVVIRDVLMTSVVICFHTTEQGFRNINAGKLTKKPFGIRDSIERAALIESFDFESGYFICKNSWGDLGGSEPRFQLDLSALDDYEIIQVYWTHESLAKKKKPLFIENYHGAEVTVKFEGYDLQTRQMDEKTALYNTKYICQRELVHGEEVWVGYDADKLIKIKQETTPKLKSAKGPQTDLPYTFLRSCLLLNSSPDYEIFFPGLEVTKDGANSIKFAFSERASGTLLVDPPITWGVVRWTVCVEYGCKDSSFVIGTIPRSFIHGPYKFLDKIDEAMAFTFTNKDKTMRSYLSGIKKDHNEAINPHETMVEHTSTVAIEVDCNMRVISFFVNDVKVPHVITEIGLPLYVGMSVEGESDVSFTTLSLCRLSSSTPSNVKLTMHKALFPADLAKEEAENNKRIKSLLASADEKEREIDKARREKEMTEKEKIAADVLAEALRREVDKAKREKEETEKEKFAAQVRADRMKKERDRARFEEFKTFLRGVAATLVVFSLIIFIAFFRTKQTEKLEGLHSAFGGYRGVDGGGTLSEYKVRKIEIVEDKGGGWVIVEDK